MVAFLYGLLYNLRYLDFLEVVMAIDYDVIMKINRIATGDELELERGAVCEQMIDIEAYTRNMIDVRADRAKAFYRTLTEDRTVVKYSLDSLNDEIETMKKQIEEHLAGDEGETAFEKMYSAIEKLFVSPPFEGLDSVPYGICELCVFSVLEYFAVREKNYDHEDIRSKYKASIAGRTEKGSADYWIGIFDMLQERFDSLSINQCSQMAVAAMRAQNEEYFDAIRKNAENMGEPSLNARILSDFVLKTIG